MSKKPQLPINAQISERIVQRAAELNLSQADISRKLGCSRSTVNGWYSGAAPRPEYLRGLRDVLRVSQDWLEGVSNTPSAKNESDLFSSLDRVWDLKPGNKITTNAVLIPCYNYGHGVDHAHIFVFPTRFFDNVADPRGLVFCEIDGESFVYDALDVVPQNKARRFILALPGDEITAAEVKRDLSGDLVAKINGETVNLSAHDSIIILGRCVLGVAVL